MDKSHGINKAVDSIQQRLTSYACDLNYDDLSPEVIHAAKVRIIDTLGALVGGFFGEPCRVVRNIAAQMPSPAGATVIGTRIKTTPEMAALVNATTARYPELTDSYHWPGSAPGHASDVITPALAAAEHAQVNGREFITGVVLGYEVYLRIANVYNNVDEASGDILFDHTNFACVSAAVAAGKLLGLSASQLSHCISIAILPNVVLRQVRNDFMSMFKAVATGHAGRAGVFAAILARGGLEGPHLPFEGKAGWCNHIAGERFSLDTMGGNGVPFLIPDTQIKNRPAAGTASACILAAEKVSPLNLRDVKQVIVEVYAGAKMRNGTGERRWNPDSREGADHSIPYLVAAAFMDGTVTLRSFNDAHLWNPELRALLPKVEVVENKEFTEAHNKKPVEHRSRVTVVTHSGERLVGEAGGDQDDLASPKSDKQIEEKFRGLTEDYLGAQQVTAILDRLWHLDEVRNVAEIPPTFVFA